MDSPKNVDALNRAGLTAADAERLLHVATGMRANAYVPYSKFRVGAALLTESGETFGGCNVENASYGLCLCAERTAIVSAVAAGHVKFRAIACMADTTGPVSPCGACRQFLIEFDPNMVVILGNLSGDTMITTANDLLPGAFRFVPDEEDNSPTQQGTSHTS